MREDRPSQTALLIAQAMCLLARDPELAVLVPAEAAEAYGWFLAMGDPARLRAVERFGRSAWGRAIAYASERCVIPGVMVHYAVRKRFLEDVCRRALADGLSQVVILGAGFDTLALRLHREFPSVEFVECDHPATQRVKRLALESHAGTGANLHLLPVDLAEKSLADVIASLPEYRQGAGTLLLAEGLTMYLRDEEIDLLFAFLWDHAGPGSRLAFTFMQPGADGKVDFPSATPIVRPWLRLAGEPFTWGVRLRDLSRFLAERGYTLDEVADDRVLRERYLAPVGLAGRRLAVGEYVCVARRMP